MVLCEVNRYNLWFSRVSQSRYALRNLSRALVCNATGTEKEVIKRENKRQKEGERKVNEKERTLRKKKLMAQTLLSEIELKQGGCFVTTG